MFAAVLVLALCLTMDPVRLGIPVLLVSRPRPLVHLLAYWLGGMASAVFSGSVALFLLGDYVPMVMHDVTSIGVKFTGGYVRIAAGVLALLFAAMIEAGFFSRRRVGVPLGDTAPSALAQRPSTPSGLARLAGRAQRVWQVGHPGVAFVFGLTSGMPPEGFLVALATILASGASLGAQLGAVGMFAVVVLWIVEIPLVSYLATPTKTEAVVLQLQYWMRAYLRRLLSRRLLAVIAAVVGVLLVTTGLGSV